MTFSVNRREMMRSAMELNKSSLLLFSQTYRPMEKLTVAFTVLICLSLSLGCERKQSYASACAPEVLVTEVTRKDVPSVKEWVAMPDGFVNAAIIAPVSGYLISQDYKEGTAVKKGDLLF